MQEKRLTASASSLNGLPASGFQPLSHKTAKNRKKTYKPYTAYQLSQASDPKTAKNRINRINGINRKSFLRFIPIPFIRFLTVFCGFGCAWSQPLSQTAKNRINRVPFNGLYGLYGLYGFLWFWVCLHPDSSLRATKQQKTAKNRINRIMRNSFPKQAIPKQQKTV